MTESSYSDIDRELYLYTMLYTERAQSLSETALNDYRKDLAELFEKQERYVEARQMYKECIDENAKEYFRGIKMYLYLINTVQTKQDLARVCDKMGDHEEAALLYEQCLNSRRRIQTWYHEDTQELMRILGELYIRMSNIKKFNGSSSSSSAVKANSTNAGKHALENSALNDLSGTALMAMAAAQPDALDVIYRLAVFYINRGDNRTAERVLEDLMGKLTQRGTSRDDPGLLDVMNLLSAAYLARDNYVNATPLLKELLYARERKYGRYGHSGSLEFKKKTITAASTLFYLAESFTREGKYDYAEEQLLACYATLSTERPVNVLLQMKTVMMISEVFSHQSRFEEEEWALLEWWSLRQKTRDLVTSRISTLQNIRNMRQLAKCLENQGRLSDAAAMVAASTASFETINNNNSKNTEDDLLLPTADAEEELGDSATVTVGDSPSVAVGDSPSVTVGDSPSVTIGDSPSVAVGDSASVAIGDSPSVAVGDSAVGDSLSIAIGNSPTIAIGETPSVAVGDSPSVAVGDSPSVAVGDSPSVAVGDSPSVTVGDNPSVAVGDSASVTVGDSSSITVGDSPSVAVGDSASVAVGDSPSVTVGDSASVTVGDSPSVAVGDSPSVAVGDSASVAVGDSASVAMGDSPSVTVGDSASVAVGDSASVAVGDSASVAVGDSPSVAVGDSSSVAVGDSTSDAVGDSSSDAVGDSPSVAIGDSASAVVDDNASVAASIDESIFDRQRRLFNSFFIDMINYTVDISDSQSTYSWEPFKAVTYEVIKTLRARGDDAAAVDKSSLEAIEDQAQAAANLKGLIAIEGMLRKRTRRSKRKKIVGDQLKYSSTSQQQQQQQQCYLHGLEFTITMVFFGLLDCPSAASHLAGLLEAGEFFNGNNDPSAIQLAKLLIVVCEEMMMYDYALDVRRRFNINDLLRERDSVP